MKGPELAELSKTSGQNIKVLIVHARWNAYIIKRLVESTTASLLQRYGVQEANLTIRSVPGSWELPMALKQDIQNYDVAIAIGVLIKGETMHFEYISQNVSAGLMQIQLESGKPVIFGVLTVLTQEQAEQRAGIHGRDHAPDWAAAAVEMAIAK
ncbi:6,7-dimethyl-8-ribityllumazine synthase [Neolecta irregularis DAH-3]|uniref:6,7-dimethyl-8-ribityllumazine synthase n=1 Tax=Neolecta irregularis (strain DAH-3) TaxID=1198029 RepID=A0A1U7LN54_NEOID|nr:6,7-dimethyl-8-ribityllumazine synthase [Neolecta irregularis DAH-3]|eukprot:OLL24069.1 6,7-dimethyl-8-ribityllumazine synthase [Neolecta irregularis DAH-3]